MLAIPSMDLRPWLVPELQALYFSGWLSLTHCPEAPYPKQNPSPSGLCVSAIPGLSQARNLGSPPTFQLSKYSQQCFIQSACFQCLLSENNSKYGKGPMYKNVHHCIIYNSKIVEATQMPNSKKCLRILWYSVE